MNGYQRLVLATALELANIRPLPSEKLKQLIETARGEMKIKRTLV